MRSAKAAQDGYPSSAEGPAPMNARQRPELIERSRSGSSITISRLNRSGRLLHGFRRDIIIPSSDNFALRVVKVLHRVLDAKRLARWVIERVPDDVKPVRIAELGGLVPLVRCEANRLAARPAFHLDAADARDGIAVAGLRVGRTEASDVEADLQMANALALPPARGLEGDHDVFCRQFRPATNLRVQVVSKGGKASFG